MKLTLLGTRGCSEASTRRHRRHAALEAAIAHDGLEVVLR